MDNIEIYQFLLNSTSELIEKFLNEAAGNAIATITPFVTVSFMVVILWYAYKVMFGQIEQPVSQLIMKCLAWSLVMSSALAAGAYQSNIANVLKTLPNDVAASVASGKASSEGKLGSFLDSILNEGVKRAKAVFAIKTGMTEFGLAIFYLAIGAGILMVSVEITVVGFIMLILATVAVSFLAAIGPFFIAALMFDSTRNFFWAWVSQVLYWATYMVLFALCALFVLSLYGHFLNQVEIDKDNLLSTFISCGIVCIFGTVIFFMIPRIAGGLTHTNGGSMVGAVSGLVRTVLTTVAVVKTAGAAAGLRMAGAATGTAAIRGNAHVPASIREVTTRPPRGYNRM